MLYIHWYHFIVPGCGTVCVQVYNDRLSYWLAVQHSLVYGDENGVVRTMLRWACGCDGGKEDHGEAMRCMLPQTCDL